MRTASGRTLVALRSQSGRILPALAAPASLVRSDGQATSHLADRKNARKAAKKTQPKAPPPTAVRDLRFKAHVDYTRLVFDLQRSVTFTQSRQKDPDRVIIEIQDSELGKAAKARLASKKFPPDIAVNQPNPRSVTVSLNLDTVTDYKLLPLKNPDRLVLDVYYRAPGAAPPRTRPACACPALRTG